MMKGNPAMLEFRDWPWLAKWTFLFGLFTCGLPFILLWLPVLWLVRTVNADCISPEMMEEDDDPWTA
jgi:hypothetical protein